MKKICIVLMGYLIFIGSIFNIKNNDNSKNIDNIETTSSDFYGHLIYLNQIQTKYGEWVEAFDAAGSVSLSIIDESSALEPDPIYNNAITIFKNRLYNFHKLYDRHYYYVDDAGNDIINLRHINESYGTNQKLKIEKELYDVLNLGIDLTKDTEGYFNIAVGALADIWASYITINEYWWGGYQVFDPAEELLNAARKCIPTYKEIDDYIVLEKSNNDYYVTFKKYNKCNSNLKYIDENGEEIVVNKVQISLGAIGKGYAVARVRDELDDISEIPNFIINGGNSSISVGETNNFISNNNNKIYISSPQFVFSKYIGSQKVSKIDSIATSGDYLRSYAYCDKNGKLIIRHHIIDPFTGYPLNYHRVITIFGEDAGILDAISTALFNLDLTDGYNLIQKLSKKYGTIDVIWQTNFANVVNTYDIKSLDIYLTDNLLGNFEITSDFSGIATLYYIEDGIIIKPKFNLFKHIQENFWSIYLPILLISITIIGGLVQALIKKKKEKKLDESEA